MSSTEEHVVSMRFNNKDFERNAQKSLGTIEKLKQSLNFKESSKSLKELNKDMNNLDVSQLNKTMEALENRFSSLGVVGASVLNRLTNSAIDFGKSLINDVTKPMTNAINQIKTGGLNRAFNLEHARFQLMGLTNDAKKVSEILDGPVAQAVDGTAYGLDQAAVAASSLVASGLKTEELLNPLSAISGVASMTGRDFSDIADIFTTVASNGKLMTMQLRQLSASGLNASAALAKSMNKTEAEINAMVTQGKISFADFSNAMNQAFGENAKRANETFNGALSNVKAALSRIGAKVATPGLEYMRDVFNELRPVINKFNEQLGSTNDPGTAIYKINDMMKSIRQSVIDFLKGEKAMKLVVGAANFLTIALDKVKKLMEPGGPIRTGFGALGNILKAIKSWIEPVAQAFLDIFPPTTIKRITEILTKFKDFTEKLKASDTIANNIRRTFRGVFAVIRAVAETIKMVATQIWTFVKGLAPAGEAATGIFGTLGDILVNVAYYIRVIIATIGYVLDYFGIMENLGQVVGNIFSSLGNLLNSVITLIGGALVTVGNAILGVFGVVLPPVENAGDVIGLVLAGIGAAIDVVLGLINWLATAISNVASVFTGAAEGATEFGDGINKTTGILGIFKNILSIIGGVIGTVIDAIGAFFSSLTGSSGLMDGIIGIFVKLGEAIKKAWDFLIGLFTGNGNVSLSDIFSKIGEGLAFVGRGIKTLTADLTPGNIAAAAFVGIMIAMSIAITKLIFSFTKVSDGLAHMTNSIGGFFDALKAKISPAPKSVQIIQSLTGALIAMVGAIVILSNLPNRDEAIKSLAIIAGIMAGLGIVMAVLSKVLSKSHSTIVMVKTMALNMAALGAAVLALAIALRIMNTVNTDGLLIKAGALAIVIATFGVISALMAKIAPRLSMGALALIAFAFAVKIIAEALVLLTSSEVASLGTSVPALVAIIAGVALAAALMSSVRFSSGLGMIMAVLAIKMALPIIKDVIEKVKDVSFQPLVQFVEDYKWALLIIAGFAAIAAVIIKKIADSFAKLGITFITIAASIWIMTQAIQQLGNMPIGDLLKGAGVVAGMLTFFAIFAKLYQKIDKDAKPQRMALAFILMSGAVAALAGVTILLSLIDWGDAIPGIVGVGVILAVFALMMKLADKTKEAKPVQMAIMFLAMAGAVAALSAIIYMMGQLDWGTIGKGAAVVGGLLGIFALFMLLAKKTKEAKPKEMGIMFVLMSGAIAILSYCVYQIGQMKLGDVIQGGVVVAALMLLLMGLTKQTSKLKPAQTKAILMNAIAMIAEIGAVIAAVIIVGQQPLADVVQGGIVVAAAMLLIEKFIEKISGLKIASNWKAILATAVEMFGAIGTIVAAILIVGNMSLGSAIQGAVVVLAALAIYTKIFQKINETKIKTKAVNLFLKGALALIEIAGAIWLASAFSNWASILAAAAGIAVVLVFMGNTFEHINKVKINQEAIGQFLKATASTLEIAVAIAIGAAFADWTEIAASLVGIILILKTMTEAFEEISKVNIDQKQVNMFLLATASTLEIAVAILIASQGKDWASIAAGMVGIVFILQTMARAFTIINKTKADIKKVSLFLLATVSTIGIAGAIWLASAFSNAGAILAAWIGLAVILAELAIIFKMINSTKVDVKAILAFDSACIALLAVGGGLRLIADAADWRAITPAMEAMAVTLGVLAGVCIAFGVIGATAIKGALILDAVVAVIALGIIVIAGIVALLENFLSVSEWIKTAGNVIAAIGEVIGRAIGAFIKGIGMELADLIPVIGEKISAFAKNAKPFFDIMSEIDGQKVFSNVANVAGALLILGAAEFGNAIADLVSRFLGGGMVEMVKNLWIFGAGIAKFSELTSGITNVNNFKTITEAAKNLAQLMVYLNSQTIQNAFTQWVGFKDFDKTAEDLKKIAEGMGEIADSLNGVNIVNVEKLNSCSEAMKQIADAAPKQPGLIQKAFTGFVDIAKSADDLKYFAGKMGEVSEAMDGEADIKPENMKKLGACGEAIKTIVDALPPQVSIFEGWWGKDGAKENLSSFGMNVVDFAIAMSAISKAMDKGSIDEANIQTFGRASKVFTDLANSLPDAAALNVANGLYTIGGKQTIKDLASDLGYLGTGITNFCNGIAGADTSKINTVTPFVKAMGVVALATSQISDTEIVSFANTFTNFSKAMQNFNDGLKDVDQENIKKFSTIIDKLLSTFNKKFTDESKYEGLTKVFQSFTKISDLIKTIKVDGSSDIETFRKTINDFKTDFGAFLTYIKTYVDDGTFDSVKNKLKEFKEALKNTTGKSGSKGDYSEFTTFAKTLNKVSKSISKLMTGDAKIDDFQLSLTKLGDSYKNFITGMNGISGGKGGDIAAVGKKIKEFGKALEGFNDSKIDLKSLNKASQQLDETITHIKDAIDNLQSDIKGSYDGFKDIGEMILKKLDVGLSSKTLRANLKKDGEESLKKFADGADPQGKGSGTVLKYLQVTANHIIEGFQNGLKSNSNYSKMEQAGVDLARKFMDGFKSKKGVDEHSPSKAMKQSGQYVVEGFLIGLKKNMKQVDGSGEGMANTFLDSFKDVMGIHSPASALIEAAKNTVAGWLKGLKSGASKIFGSGASFGGDFLGGLKSVIGKISKGDFNGDKLINSFKKKLGLEKIFDTKKDMKKLSSKLSGGLSGVNKDLKKNSGRGASSAGSNAAKEYAKAFAKGLVFTGTALSDIVGTEMSKKDLADALWGKKAFSDKKKKKLKKEYKKAAGDLLSAYNSAFKNISKNKDFLHNMKSNTAAIIKFAKTYQKAADYFNKTARSLTIHAGSALGEVSAKTLETVGSALYRSSKDYKTSEKNIKNYEAKIESIQKSSLKKSKKMKELAKDYEAAKKIKDEKKREKALKKLSKQMSTLEKKIENNEKKVKDLRKKIEKEVGKIAEGSMKAIKEVRAESKELYKSWLDFSNLNLENSNIMTGLEKLEVQAIGTSESVDDLDEALSESSESASEASKAYDGLSASMDTGINLMERFSKTGFMEAGALFENADSQLNAYEEFQNGIEELEKRGLDSTIVDQLASEGPQALNKIRGFLSMSSKQVDEYNARVDKQKEYEAKALERNLRRQYEMWKEYLAKVEQLKAKFGSGYESDAFYKGMVGKGIEGLNFMSAVLRMDGTSFRESKKYFAEGLTSIMEDSEVTESIAESSEIQAKSIFNGLTNAINKLDKTSELDEAYKKAIANNLDKDVADYIYSKGEKDGLAYFKGLEEANNYSDVNSKWKEYTEKNTKKNIRSIFDNINEQVERQSKNIKVDRNNSIQNVITTFLKQYQSKNMSDPNLKTSIQNYTNGFNILIKELQDAGYDSTTILETVEQWVKNDGDNWNELTKTLDNLNKRAANNVYLSGQSVKESWDQVIKNTRENAQHLMSINQKMGGKMTKQMYDYLQGLSPEELAAFDSLSESELQTMAQEWYDADLAADVVADNITTSWIKAYETADKNFTAWYMNRRNGLYDTTKEKGNSDDRRYEIAKYLTDMIASGKSIDDVLKDIKNMDSKTKESLFKFGKENKYLHLNELNNLLKKYKGKDWNSVLKDLERNSLTIGEISKTYGTVIDGAIRQGEGVAAYVRGEGTYAIAEGLYYQIEDMKDPSSDSGKALRNYGVATYNAVVENGTEGAAAGAKEVANNAANSASKTYSDSGSELGTEFINGAKQVLKDSSDALSSPVHKLAKKAKDDNKKYYKEKGNTLGKQMIAGLKEGIKNSEGEVSKVASSIAVSIYKAVCKTLGIKSPSRVFMEVGDYIDQGLAQGIVDNSSVVDGSANTLTDSLLANFRASIQTMQDVINGEIDTNPVIMPTLDLSQINKEVNGVGNLFDATVGLNAKVANSEDQNNQNGDTSGVTFVQNNYSPKALSRFEIYRDTRTLLSVTSGKVGLT